MFLKTAILIFVIQLDAVKTFRPVHSIDDLVREVSTAVSEKLMAHDCPDFHVKFLNPEFP